ncbi:MAG: helix-turn-helix transcriptional regulator [Pseudomonadota bacterium]
MKFPILIKNGRTALGMSQQELANTIGVSRNYISMIESGKRIPSLSLMTHIFDVLDIDPSKAAAHLDIINFIRKNFSRDQIDQIISELDRAE